MLLNPQSFHFLSFVLQKNLFFCILYCWAAATAWVKPPAAWSGLTGAKVAEVTAGAKRIHPAAFPCQRPASWPGQDWACPTASLSEARRGSGLAEALQNGPKWEDWRRADTDKSAW